jgi:arginyl-tRNA synthetase
MNSYETIKQALQELAGVEVIFSLNQPEDMAHGDYATNIAFPLSKIKGVSPKVCAEELVATFTQSLFEVVEKIEVAGPGFINFFLKDDVRTDGVEDIARSGIVRLNRQEKVLVEYTDPNCFKVFHIGHLMANAIGESLSRIYEVKGYDVTRVCYPSDIGRNVAMGVWGVMKKAHEAPSESAPLKERIAFLGMCYAYANHEYEINEEAKYDIIEVNRAIYEGTNPEVMAGRRSGRRR